MERYAVDSRCSRGRSYARDGQVVHVEVAPGRISAEVQGGRVKPYLVELLVTPVPAQVWDKVADTLKRNPLMAAKLLAGDLPEEVEQVVSEAGGTLFPNRLRHVRNRCECEDWSNPCKHAAAVYYVVGREFHRDPRLFLSFRGAGRDLLPERGPAVELVPQREQSAPFGSLPADPAEFWSAPSLPDDVEGEFPEPSEAWNLLEHLGPPPFWAGRRPLSEALEPMLRAASRAALHVLIGERDARRSLKAGGRRSERSAGSPGDRESP